MSAVAQYDVQVKVAGLGNLKALEQYTTKYTAAMRGAQVQTQQFAVAANQNLRGVGAMGARFQNASYQLQDFIVQVQNGTSASRALSMQLPQLLGGFGAVGAAAGVAAGLLIPFAANLSIVQENIDRVIGYATGLAVVLGGKFLLGLSAASGGFVLATKSAVAFAFSLKGVKLAL
ncbi:MAG: hypothetical protein ACO3Z6_16350, partial [Pseudomonadales bacterium]